MKILIVNTIYPTKRRPMIVGGAEKSVRYLAEELARRGNTVEVVRGIAPGQKADVEELNGVTVHSFPIRNFYWPFDGTARPMLLRALWHFIDDLGAPPAALEDLIKRFMPDVIHTNVIAGITTNIWSLAKRYNIKIVHTLRDYYLLCAKSTLFKNGRLCDNVCLECKITTLRRKANTALVDVVVGNSNATLNLHLNSGAFPQVKSSMAIGSLAEYGKYDLDDAIQVKSSRRVFGYIGRVSEEKGIDVFAQALSKFGDAGASFIVAGRVSEVEADRLRSLAHPVPIEFLGFVEPADFYIRVDVVVCPSLWHEPLPRSVIDALDWKKPVLGSNRGGVPEAMGVPPYGWIFDPGVEGDLEVAIQAALSSTDLPSRSGDAHIDPVQKYLEAYGEGF